jgi:GNAT superfamily N-acetyltransferase
MASPSAATLPETTYVAGFQPGFLGRIAQMHGEYYAKVWGSGVPFEAQMAHELYEFSETYDPERDLLLTAHVDGLLVGSIAINGSQAERPGAQLRWYILTEEYQGRGIGRVLLDHALAFCRERGFESVFLWTVEGLPQSRRLYEKAGFRLVESVRDDRYTIEHVNLRFEMSLRD